MSRRTWLLALLFFLFVLLGYGLLQASRVLEVATGYSSKILCSGIFLSGRGEETLRTEDLEWFPFLDCEVDRDEKSASCDLWGAASRKALFREELGCTLVIDASVESLRLQVGRLRPAPQARSAFPPPAGGFVGVDRAKLDAALDKTFAEPNPDAPRRTRAVVVLFRGGLLAERYAAGFDVDTRLGGWSMTKSVVNALVGILVGQGRLDPQSPAPVPEWAPPDERAAITLNHLLRMSSGLEFDEDYSPPSDATRMLFAVHDAAAFAAAKPAAHPPGSRWSYSSGTANIVSRIVRQTVGGSLADYQRFVRRELFDRLKMDSAVMEPDPSGTFVGSSFMYAAARDWARFGQLYLQDGVWEGNRILPEGWVGYTVQPVQGASKGRYGAHWWLNAGDPPGSKNRIWPNLPADVFFASGFEGQFVVAAPSRQLVVVRLGLTHSPARWRIDQLVADVLEALPAAKPPREPVEKES